MPAEPSLISYYAKRAGEYDRIYQKPERQEDLAKLRALVRAYFINKSVYEVACGTGYWTEQITSVAKSVFAIDYNQEMVTLAQARLSGFDNVVCGKADAFSPPKSPMLMDAGFAGFWWSHLKKDELNKFLEVFLYSIGPGASFAFLDNTYVAGSSTPIARSDEEGNTYQVRRLEDGSEYEVLKNFPSLEQIQRALAPWATNVRITFYAFYWWVEGEVK